MKKIPVPLLNIIRIKMKLKIRREEIIYSGRKKGGSELCD